MESKALNWDHALQSHSLRIIGSISHTKNLVTLNIFLIPKLKETLSTHYFEQCLQHYEAKRICMLTLMPTML